MRKAVLLLTCVVSAVSCSAEIITVDDDAPADYTSIQDAILDALDGDIIEVRPGVYYENVYFYGRAVTVTSVDPNDPDIVDQTIIDGAGLDSVATFAWAEGPDSVITGFTITGGRALYGAGICCWQSSPTIVKNTITRNDTDEDYAAGAGIYCYQSSAHIERNFIVANYLSGDHTTGGGIYCLDSPVKLLNNEILTNGCVPDYDQTQTSGGGISCILSSPIISNNRIALNVATGRGGGIYCDSTSAVITHNTVVANRLWYETGVEGLAICVTDTAATANYPQISHNYIHYNSGFFSPAKGGAIACLGTSPQISNNIIANNMLDQPDSYGGGIYCDSNSSPTIHSNTITTNSASLGGGIYFPQGSSPSIKNNIIVKNAGAGVYWKYTAPAEFSYNCVWGNSGADYTGWAMPGPGDISAEPLFAEVTGGFYFLKSEFGRWDEAAQAWVTDDVTSPCINRGDPTIPIGAEPFPNGGRINMGAYGATAKAAKSAEIPASYCIEKIFADITADCRVNFSDVEALAYQWLGLETPQPGLLKEWTAAYDAGDTYEVAHAMAIDSSGGIYVGGDRNLVKYDPNGRLHWAACDGTYDSIDAIAVDSLDNAYVTRWGRLTKYAPDTNQPLWTANNDLDYSLLIIDSGDNIYVSGPADAGDLATIKYSPDSNHPIWVALHNGPGWTADTAVDGDDNVYVLSEWPLLIKYAPDSNQPVWAADFEQIGPDDYYYSFYPLAMVIDSKSNIYVTGVSSVRPGYVDCTTVKYSADSNQPVWVATYSGDGFYNEPAAIAVDSSDNVYVTGWNDRFDSVADCFTIKYDPNANQLWAAPYNGPVNGADGAFNMVIDTNDNIFVLGTSDGWNEDSGIVQALVLIKYDSDGNQLSVKRDDASRTSEILAAERAGTLYITGYQHYGVAKYAPADTCPGNLPGDFNIDCKVDFADFAIMASDWLDCNLYPAGACAQ